MRVLNWSELALPTAPRFTADERRRMADSQRRQHLEADRVWTDTRTGQTFVTRMLSDEERLDLADLELRRAADVIPRYGSVEFPFGRRGQPGCLWEVPDNVGRLLLSQAPLFLEVVDRRDPRLKGLRVRKHGHIPSTFEFAYGARSVIELMGQAPAEAEQVSGFAPIVLRDGHPFDLDPLPGGRPEATGFVDEEIDAEGALEADILGA